MEGVSIGIYLLHLHWNLKTNKQTKTSTLSAEALWHTIKHTDLNYYSAVSSRLRSALAFYGCILQDHGAHFESLHPHFLSETSKPKPPVATCSCFPVQVRKSGPCFLSTCHGRKDSGKLLPEHTLPVQWASDSWREWWMNVSEKGRWPSTPAHCRTWDDRADLAPADTWLWRGVKGLIRKYSPSLLSVWNNCWFIKANLMLALQIWFISCYLEITRHKKEKKLPISCDFCT